MPVRAPPLELGLLDRHVLVAPRSCAARSAAISALGSIATTFRPRVGEQHGGLAGAGADLDRPVDPRRRPAYSSTSSTSADGYDGRLRSYSSATPPKLSRRRSSMAKSQPARWRDSFSGAGCYVHETREPLGSLAGAAPVQEIGDARRAVRRRVRMCARADLGGARGRGLGSGPPRRPHLAFRPVRGSSPRWHRDADPRDRHASSQDAAGLPPSRPRCRRPARRCYRQYITPAEFVQRFGASAAASAGGRVLARAHGLRAWRRQPELICRFR